MRNYEKVYYSGYQGSITGVYGIAAAPALFETDPHEMYSINNQKIVAFELTTEEGEAALIHAIEEKYRQWEKYGPYGDVIGVTLVYNRNVIFGFIDFFGRKAFHKPGLAADLLPFIRDKNGKTFFVGIIRAHKPGKDRPVLLGGFLNVNGFHLETAAEALIHEGREEAGLRIYPEAVELYRLKNTPFADHIKVVAVLGDDLTPVSSELRLIGTFPTSIEENLVPLGLKRVYQTTAYLLEMEVDEALSVKKINEWLKAGDDAKALYVFRLGGELKQPDFFIGHHKEIFAAAVKML